MRFPNGVEYSTCAAFGRYYAEAQHLQRWVSCKVVITWTKVIGIKSQSMAGPCQPYIPAICFNLCMLLFRRA